MSQFQINKSGTDQVSVEFSTTGSSEATVNLKHEILDQRLKYVFCVDSLSLPLNKCPINLLANTELFRVQRRNVGASLDVAADVAPLFSAAAHVYTLNRTFFDITTFVQSLNNWARTFELAVTLAGIQDFRLYGKDAGIPNGAGAVDAVLPLLPMELKTPAQVTATGRYDLIKFVLAVDGSLLLQTQSNFSNNYMLKFTREGAEILGLSPKISEVTVNLPGLPAGQTRQDYYLTITTTALGVVGIGPNWLDVAGGNVIVAGGNLRDTLLYGDSSLYQVCDQRTKITLVSHLPMLGSVLVAQGKETIDRNILEVFFTQTIKSTVQFDEDGVFTQQALTNSVYSGQYAFVSKSDVSKQWHRLLTSFDQRFLRFYLYITYRVYDSTKDEWVMKPMRVPIPDKHYWNFTIRFLSEV